MSKVGGALPSWYWPAGVPRRVPVAHQPLDRILRQRFAKDGSAPALASGATTVSCSELLAQANEIAGGIQASAPAGAIAIGETNPLEGARLLLGALFAGRPVFLANHAAPDLLKAQLAEAKVAAILTSGFATEGLCNCGVATLSRDELKGAFKEGPSRRATEPAVLLPSGQSVVVHSHFSLSAMAAALAAFIVKLRELPFVCMETGIGSWETLAAMVLTLMYGMPVVFTSVEELKANRQSPILTGGYLIVSRRDADAMIRDGHVPRAIAEMPYVFVSTRYFKPRWRRKFEALCRRPIFPLWGLPELGPVVAPHPTWLPIHGHGLPLVNVSLIPVDPGTGKVSIVPWEMLEQAEVGVETLSAMVGYTEPKRNAEVRVGTVLRTRQIAAMDHVGVVILHEQGDGQAAATAR